MKIKLLAAIVLFAIIPAAHAQVRATATSHSVTLFWVASTDAALNPTLGYQLYRLNGACPAVAPTSVATAAGFVLISGATPLTALTYTDLGFPVAPLPPGAYCYFVVSTLNGAQSVPSNLEPAVVLPASPVLGLPSTT
jgi:hypothetical protein